MKTSNNEDDRDLEFEARDSTFVDPAPSFSVTLSHTVIVLSLYCIVILYTRYRHFRVLISIYRSQLSHLVFPANVNTNADDRSNEYTITLSRLHSPPGLEIEHRCLPPPFPRHSYALNTVHTNGLLHFHWHVLISLATESLVFAANVNTGAPDNRMSTPTTCTVQCLSVRLQPGLEIGHLFNCLSPPATPQHYD